MVDALSDFISNDAFPCIMAKSVLKQMGITHFQINSLIDDREIKRALEAMYFFVGRLQTRRMKLSSFILSLNHVIDLQTFEKEFWFFLKQINYFDKLNYSHDSRVSSDPESGEFSFSIKEEAFFILALHPDGPRESRRFKFPAIVFNPHEQFEILRKKGQFLKIRNYIREKDTALQGEVNPMLNDFGEKSEVYQYLGIEYPSDARNPLI